MINGRTGLRWANGTMTGHRYIDEVLPLVRLFRGAVGDKFVFMHDNATCHRSLQLSGLSSGLYSTSRMASVFFRPLKPMENSCMFEIVGRETMLRQTRTPAIRALTEEWNKLASSC
ncbi:hypothetical protein TNCV_1741581 [Trichonephila clavipes]|uniref:Transposase n=1 Tax=Trichonephila clavipes TaxID=2585209 RepID=A0A8X6V2I4_TRICX|nr:hypothetical protein TNCV_1741581 [Trichonephila clavipes]